MKRFILWAVVPAFVALVEIAYCNQPFHIRYAPAIRIVMQDPTGGGANYLPAIDGFVGVGSMASSGGSAGNYSAVKTYKVVSVTEGHFFILAHYDIYRGGVSTQVDRAFPVMDKKPDPANWTKLDDRLIACAYLTGTQTGY